MASIKQTTLTAVFAYTTTAITLQASEAYDYVDELAHAIADKVLYSEGDDEDWYVDLTQDNYAVTEQILNRLTGLDGDAQTLFEQLKQDICPDGECIVDGSPADIREFIARVTTDYFRGDDYTQMTGEGITEVLLDEIECQNDPDCHDRPEDVFEWLEEQYMNHQSSETFTMREEYYEMLRKDVAYMVTQKAPAHLLADHLNLDQSEITPEWRNTAEETVFNGFEEFDLDGLLRDVADLQVERLIEHFEGGDSDDCSGSDCDSGSDSDSSSGSDSGSDDGSDSGSDESGEDSDGNFETSDEIWRAADQYSFGDYTWYVQDRLLPHFEDLREQNQLTQGTDDFTIRFDYNLDCNYAGEVNEEGQAHGEGVGTCATDTGDKTVTGTFMFGVPHGVIKVERPDGAVSTYEVRENMRYGKETYRTDKHALIYNITWKEGNDGSEFNTANPASNVTAFYDADGTVNTAYADDWERYA